MKPNFSQTTQRTPLTFSVNQVRDFFPALSQKIHGKPLIYFDNAASTLKPSPVVEALSNFSLQNYANIHRGIHTLSQKATQAFENSREKVQEFLHAKSEKEIIFVRGATEGINLLAHSFGQKWIFPGDEILISTMEHHSNITPWQILCENRGSQLKIVPITDSGEIRLEDFEKAINKKTKLISLTHVSNALGTINPVKEMIQIAHQKGVPVLLDGAQAAPHLKIDVQELDCDFYVLSGHKMYGPTGIGVLYGKFSKLEELPPYQTGGEMILSVSFEKTLFKEPPLRFEAGTPDIIGAIGLAATIDFLSQWGPMALVKHEETLLHYASEKLLEFSGLKLVGTAKAKAGVISFVLEGIHPHDIGTILDQEGIAVRAGHHCAQPLMDRLGLPATTRVSFGIYNTKEEIDQFIQALHKVCEIFS